MKLIVHRGTDQIGGSCVELASGKTRILLDFGRPLPPCDPAEAKERNGGDAALLPGLQGLYTGQPDPSPVDAVVISHAHQDHYGLLSHIKAGVKIFAGAPTARLMEMTTMFGPDACRLASSRFTPFSDGKPFDLGDFTVTPYLADHSAFDAHGFLVEARGEKKHVFYSGDFRAHGRKAALFERFMRTGPSKVNVLLLEGTMLSRAPVVKTENTVENDIVRLCRRPRQGIVLAYLSSQNIDRITAFFRAARRTGMFFAVDLYTAWVLSEVKGKTGIPVPSRDYPEMRVFYPYRLTKLIVDRMGRTDIRDRFKPFWITRDEIRRDPSKVILMVRPTMADDCRRLRCLDRGTLVYSLWDGYKIDPKVADFIGMLARAGMTTEGIHTSGHAPLPVLKRMVQKLRADAVIPIHTEHADDYAREFANVRRLRDREEMAV